jgi:hypothetical protein
MTNIICITSIIAAPVRLARSMEDIAQRNSCNDLYIHPLPTKPRRWHTVGRFLVPKLEYPLIFTFGERKCP